MEFVENWDIVSTLGEGAYGEVKLLVNRITNEAVALKVIDLEGSKRETIDNVKKEIGIHKYLKHINIIKFYGQRDIGSKCFLFLEYAPGGALFDRIEPDVGMSLREVHLYMRQLLNGLQYIHSKGIAHRDLKPENLLIGVNGVLKISDFGLATIFHYRNKERMLKTRCGTLPYVAPEVYTGNYSGVLADIWSCGIVFVVMLAGEMPWNEPLDKFIEYRQWKNDDYILESPWRKLDNSSLCLARNILNPDPKNRPSLKKILENPWMQMFGLDQDFKNSVDEQINYHSSVNFEVPQVVLSQPAATHNNSNSVANLYNSRDQVISFSQPTDNDSMLIPSQINFTQTALSKNNFQHLIKRMTRFFVKTSVQKTINLLCSVLDKLSYIWHADVYGVITISTVDNRKTPLIFKANIIEMEDKILLDFRLSKGCGLEFKRRFVKIKEFLKDVITLD